MLGYGLVQVPLTVYNHSRTSYLLSQVQFKLSQLNNERIDTEERLESLVEEVSKLCSQIKYNDPLRPCLEEIVRIIPEQYSNRVKLTMDDYEDYRGGNSSNRLIDLPTENQLIKLHRLLKKTKHVYHRVQASWMHTIDEAFYLEDILNNEQNSNHLFVRQSPMARSWIRQNLFDQHPILGKRENQEYDLLFISAEHLLHFRMVHFLFASSVGASYSRIYAGFVVNHRHLVRDDVLQHKTSSVYICSNR